MYVLKEIRPLKKRAVEGGKEEGDVRRALF